MGQSRSDDSNNNYVNCNNYRDNDINNNCYKVGNSINDYDHYNDNNSSNEIRKSCCQI